MAYFISNALMRLAGIRLNENEGKFEFCDGEVDVAPITGTSPVQESKFCSENNIDTSIKKKKQKKRRRKNSISERNVQWGTVEEIKFTRALGFHCVPSRGSFPLGLGNEEDRSTVHIDEYVSARQKELKDRYQAVYGQEVSDDLVLETRQLDYKSGVKNLLFTPLEEEHRQKEYTSTKSDMAPIVEYCKEVTSIRQSRCSTGCNCKPLKPDKLSVAKMKSELILYGYLIGLLDKSTIETMSKADLISNIRELLKKKSICQSSDCECSQNGIECSAEVCGCLHGHARVQECGNTYGQYIFNPDSVDDYRKTIITAANKCF